MNRHSLLLVAVAVLVTATPSEARRKHAHRRDDRPLTRAEAAKMIEPALDRASDLKRPNGRQVTGQDIANLESVAVDSADELASTDVRVNNLHEEIARLRAEIQQLRRRRRW